MPVPPEPDSTYVSPGSDAVPTDPDESVPADVSVLVPPVPDVSVFLVPDVSVFPVPDVSPVPETASSAGESTGAETVTAGSDAGNETVPGHTTMTAPMTAKHATLVAVHFSSGFIVSPFIGCHVQAYRLFCHARPSSP